MIKQCNSALKDPLELEGSYHKIFVGPRPGVRPRRGNLAIVVVVVVLVDTVRSEFIHKV